MLLAGIILIVLSGCSSPENNPVVKKAVKDIAAASEDISQLKSSIENIRSDVDTMSVEVEKLKKEQKSGTDASVKIAELEKKVAELQMAIGEMKRAKPVESASVKKSKESSSSAEESKPVAKGFYHKVAKGETPETIAQKYNIPVAKLLRDNNLPKTIKLIPNQQLYIIPAK